MEAVLAFCKTESALYLSGALLWLCLIAEPMAVWVIKNKAPAQNWEAFKKTLPFFIGSNVLLFLAAIFILIAHYFL